ncbi:hypothetical protein D3C77_325430 [compost metagenome]
MSFIGHLKGIPLNRPALEISTFKTAICNFCRDNVFCHNPLFRYDFMEGVECVGKNYSPVRHCIINDFEIHFFAEILGEICLILLHIRQSQTLLRIREVNVGKCAITVLGNQISRIRIDDAHIHLIRTFAPT